MKNFFTRLRDNVTKSKFSLWADQMIYPASQKSLRRKILSVTLFIVIALIISFLIMISLQIRPQSFFMMFTRLFQSTSNTQNFLYQIAIYVMAALAFSFAMNVGIFNIGISGQMLAGASTAVLLINALPDSFTSSVTGGGQILTLLLSIIGAVTVALVTGLLKIYLKVNEVVSAILLNWIILFIVAYLVRTYDLDLAAQNLGNFQSNKLPSGFAFFIPSSSKPNFIENSGWFISLIVTIISVIAVWVLMKFTVFGHKLKTTGLSSTSAKYFGYNQNYLQLASFAISGALAGILGAIVYTGQTNYLNFNSVGKFALTSVPIEGFNGIAIGLISLNNPIAIVIVSALFSLVNVGAAPAGLPSLSTVSLVTGIMMYMIAIYKLSMYLRPWRWFYLCRYGKMNSDSYLNYENFMASNTENYRFNLLNEKNKLIEIEINKKLARNPRISKFCLFWIRLHYRILGVHFIKGEGSTKAYKEIKRKVAEKYFNRRTEISNEFKYSCGYQTIIWWEDQLKTKKAKLSKWTKDRLNVVKWMRAVKDESIKQQLDRHLNSIDGLIAYETCDTLLNYWQQQFNLIIQKPGSQQTKLLVKQWNLDSEKIKENAVKISDEQIKQKVQQQLSTLEQHFASAKGGNL